MKVLLSNGVKMFTANIFCGYEEFILASPCVSSELVHFRNRIRESGMELIFKESIRVNVDDGDEPHVNVDTTVQSKNLTFPTDSKLQKKVIKKVFRYSEKRRTSITTNLGKWSLISTHCK